MRIEWYGHAAFGIVAADGTRIITDPYTPETAGYEPIPDAADLALISSDNDSFHCRADLLPGSPTVINALALARGGGQTTVSGIAIRAIEAMEALNHRYHDPDQNGMYRFEVDGVHIGHMGDVGNPLSAEQIDFFRGLDVLLALTGGHPTIELADLKAFIDAARPRIVIPMHFRTLRYRPRNILWIESFLSLFDDAQIDFPCSTGIDLTPADLPEPTRIVVLAHRC
ncbi:MAG: MBL fold metallo-hydrolase [Candidatus Flexifilum sp.]|jgi:L-ascorbate metabolism protein UlaG (beta-lactamase superfamily)